MSIIVEISIHTRCLLNVDIRPGEITLFVYNIQFFSGNTAQEYVFS